MEIGILIFKFYNALDANKDILAAGNIDPDVSYPDADIDATQFE